MTDISLKQSGINATNLRNHLGNVLAVVSDRKLPDNEPDVVSVSDYYPFGMQMPGRLYSEPSNSYRFGFGNYEKIDEVAGTGNTVDMGDRWLNVKLGRTFKLDRKAINYPSLSPYSYAANNPIMFIDPDGEKIIIYYKNENGVTKGYEYKPNANTNIDNAYLQDAIKSLNHLAYVDDASCIINELVTDYDFIVRIRENSQPENGPAFARSRRNMTSIDWSSNIGVEIEEGNQSPATILMHELDHANDAREDFDNYKNNIINISDADYDNPSDRKTIGGIETTVATFYGEGTRTNHSFKRTFIVKEPTSNQEMLLDKSPVSGTEVKLDNNTENNYIW